MTDNSFATLVRLSDTDETVADRGSDIRGRHVVDKHHKPLGKVAALLLDSHEQKIRFLEVASGGFLGLGEAKSYIPVEAISKITEHEVQVNRAAAKIAGAPAYQPSLVDQTPFYETTYGYYGMLPFWGMNHIYPNNQKRESLHED
jgi:sporulation protein YlmC with PRC-barrel domain